MHCTTKRTHVLWWIESSRTSDSLAATYGAIEMGFGRLLEKLLRLHGISECLTAIGL